MRFFHLQACHRSRKNTIAQLMHHRVPIVDEKLKVEAIFSHFDQIMGAVVEQTNGVDMDCIRLTRGQVPAIDRCFLEEVWNIIKSLPLDKAPGPDGFTCHFFQAAWPIIKHDILQALAAIWSLTPIVCTS
jgi:hypothetical protein